MTTLKIVTKAILVQGIFGLSAILIAAIVSPANAVSLATGVVLMWVATTYLLAKIWWLERHPGVSAKQVAKTFYIGQGVKFVVLVAGVIVLIKIMPLHWMSFLIGVMVVQVSGMMLSLDMKRKIAP